MSRLDALENDFWNAINGNPSEAERIAELVRDATGVRVSVQPSDQDATATEIYATSALPYPFPVDSEIYDH